MTQAADDRFLAVLGNMMGIWACGYGSAAHSLTTIAIGFLLFHLSMKLAKAVT